jgi:hypothetical protein
VHPRQQEFGRGGGDPRPLQLEDFLSLAPDLDAHVLDFPSDEVEVWHGSPPAKWNSYNGVKREQMASRQDWGFLAGTTPAAGN